VIADDNRQNAINFFYAYYNVELLSYVLFLGLCFATLCILNSFEMSNCMKYWILQKISILFQDEEKDFKVNWKRAGITSMFGFTFVGPVGHYWYIFLSLTLLSSFLPDIYSAVISMGMKVGSVNFK
jgi:hypothetical protein